MCSNGKLLSMSRLQSHKLAKRHIKILEIHCKKTSDTSIKTDEKIGRLLITGNSIYTHVLHV